MTLGGLVVITGSAGLVGSAAARYYAGQHATVIGIDDDSRAAYFGPEASTRGTREQLVRSLGRRYRHLEVDVRDRAALLALYLRYGDEVELTLHCAAQPSHDYSAADPVRDFEVNAMATVHLLDAHRRYAGDAPFVLLSTNKVYGDLASLPLRERPTRLEPVAGSIYRHGIPETFPVDQTMHSPFGASKLAADVAVQEAGRYFGLATCCLRGGTLSGGAHAGVELHGFLAYLVRCCAEGRPYRIIGYGGKQVRDVIHADDVVAAVEAYRRRPVPGAVFNLGGGSEQSVSVVEAIQLAERVTGRHLQVQYVPEPRVGDHRWYVSDLRRLRDAYPAWRLTRSVESIAEEIAAG